MMAKANNQKNIETNPYQELEEYKPEFIFEKKNYTIMIIGLVVLVIGFALMAGGGSEDPNVYSPEVFSWRRIRLAPFIVIIGFAIELYAILLNPTSEK